MTHEPHIKPAKATVVSELTTSLKEAKSIVFVDYTGMDMKTQQGLMKKLKDVNGKMLVAKNTLVRIAGGEAKLPEEVLTDAVLSGQTAVVISSEDPVAPLQVLGKFMAETEKPKWKVGVVEGNYQDAASLVRISKLPAKEQLIAQVIGGVSAPLYGLIGTLNGNIQKLVYVLSARKESMNG